MAEKTETTKAKSATPVPVLEKSAKLETGGGIQGFGQAARQGAAATNIASDIGSKMAIGAATQRAELNGLELGKNPQGDIFPAITQSDKAFEQAYKNQSKATLSLQAQDFLNTSISTLNDAGKLSAGGIQEFQASTAQGLADIVKLAPTSEQAALSNSFSSSLLETTGKFSEKLSIQIRAEQQDQRSASLTNSASETFESAANGNLIVAQAKLDESLQTIKSMFETGQISGSKRDSAIREAELSHITGIEYGKLLDAKDKGQLSKALSDFGKSDRKDMTTLEQLKVGENLFGLVKQLEAADQLNQAVQMAEANSLIDAAARGETQITKAMMDNLKLNLNEPNYLSALTKIAKVEQATRIKTDKINSVNKDTKNVNSPNIYTVKEINEGYESRVEGAMLNGADEITARGIVASNTAYPVQAHIDKINSLGTSENPQDIRDADRLINAAEHSNPFTIDGLDSRVRLKIGAFKYFSSQLPDNEAAKEAQTSVFTTNKEKEESLNLQWKAEEERTFGVNNSTGAVTKERAVILGSRKLMGVGKKVPIKHEADWAYGVKASYEKNWKGVSGISEVAKAVTNQSFVEGYEVTTENNIPGDKVGSLQRNPYSRAIGSNEQTDYIPKYSISLTAEKFVQNYNTREDVPHKYKINVQAPVTYGEMISSQEKSKEFFAKSNDMRLSRNDRAAARQEKSVHDQIIDDYANPSNRRTTVETVAEDGITLKEYYIETEFSGRDASVDGAPLYNLFLMDKNGQRKVYDPLFSGGRTGAVWSANVDEYNQSLFDEVSQTGIAGGRNYIAESRSAQEIKQDKEGKRAEKEAEFIKQATFDREKKSALLSKIDSDIDANESLSEAQKTQKKDSARSQLALVENVADPIINAVEGTGRAIASTGSKAGNLLVDGIISLADAVGSTLSGMVNDMIDTGILLSDNESSPAAKERLLARRAKPEKDEPKQFLESTGKEIVQNDDGTVSTEKTITIESMGLNDGKPTNIPTIWNGEQLTDEASIEMAIKSGEKYPSYSSVSSAEKAAVARSDKLDKEIKAQLGEDIEDIEDIEKLDASEAGSKKSRVMSAIKKAAEVTNADPLIMMVMAQLESSFGTDTVASKTSARGDFQITNAEWETLVNNFGKKHGIKLSDRGNQEKEAILQAESLELNAKAFKKAMGREPTLTERYIVHFAGRNGGPRAVKAFEKNPNAPVSAGFSAKAIRDNKNLLRGTLASTMKRIDDKVKEAIRIVS